MAVQIPDPGTGNGQTGDNEYVFRKKVKDNFTDKTNAASRLVGPATGNLMEVGAFGLGGRNTVHITDPTYFDDKSATNFSSMYGYYDKDKLVFPFTTNATLMLAYSSDWVSQIVFSPSSTNPAPAYRNYLTGREWSDWTKFWTEANATKDANGFLKAASPIVKVFADKVELNGEAEDQNVTYKKNGVGDYTITTVSGLSTDGWYIELPKDMNGNPKVAVTLSEVEGVISLKTYKRIFSMETFTFEPDLNEPLDIPEGRWIDLRLNEIPVEMPDDMKIEV